MTTESDRQATKPSSKSNPQSAELKASDFFPPGTGWNQAKKPADVDARQDAAHKPGGFDKH